MSAGSGASNLGYGETPLNSNINGQLVNKDASTYSGSFSSNELPPTGLRGISNSVLAANASRQVGGRRRKKMSRKYSKRRVSMGPRKVMRMRRTIRRLSKRVRKLRRRSSRRQRGGTPYSQYNGGLAASANYSLGGNLSAANSALASPPPVIAGSYNNCPNAYNHYTDR